MLSALVILRKFPRKQHFRGQNIGWRQCDMSTGSASIEMPNRPTNRRIGIRLLQCTCVAPGAPSVIVTHVSAGWTV
jgi:hypothetical protein